MSHAILSPSGASRWLNCTPSARLEEKFPNTTSSFAEEGTLAHSLGELIIRNRLGLIKKDAFHNQLQQIADNELYSEAMYDYCDDYAVFVLEALAKAGLSSLIFIEEQVDLTNYVPEGFGTRDVTIVGGKLSLIDLKYGKGVAVSAVENKQLMLYALGSLDEFDYLFDIKTVELIIYQPRIDNISSFEISVDDLKDWAENTLKPKAELAFAGEGDFVPGAHCQFCKAKAVCKALADQSLEIAKYEFADPNLLTDADIADILNRYDLFTTWINAVEEYALTEAINGKSWPGYKLVEGRSNRKYSDPEAAAIRLIEKGFTQAEILTAKIKGIGELEKAIGKKEFNTYLSDLIIKPQGKPALVPVSDKRPAFSSVESAKADFANV